MDYELKYGLDDDGHFVSINDVVANGLGCGCICPNCKQQLIAKTKGDKRKPHFAHYNPQQSADKKKCYEQTMHKLAKNIIEENLSIMLPALDCIPCKKVSFIKVEKEERNDSKDLQPDIVGITEDGMRIAIEIKYTHAVDSIKLHKIIYNNLTCLEVDISKRNMDINELQEFLCESDKDREWLNNPDYEERIKEDYSASYDYVVLEVKNDEEQNKYSGRNRNLVVISEIERYKLKRYQVKGREKSKIGPALPNLKKHTTPKHPVIKPLNYDYDDEDDSFLPQQNKTHSIGVIRLYNANSVKGKIVTDNSFYCLCPHGTTDHLLQDYYNALVPRKFFYNDGIIKTQISNYKKVGNRIAVIHIGYNKGRLITRLTGIEFVFGRIQHIEIDEYGYETSAEKAMIRWLNSVN